MSSSESLVNSTWSVNDVLRCFPCSLDVLNRYGIDTCCGGAETLEEAAQHIQVDVREIIDALSGCTYEYEPPADPTPRSCNHESSHAH